MSYTIIERSSWPRADQFDFFRSFERPHYAVTSRLDVTTLLAAKTERGMSAYRGCLFAIGMGMNAVAELRTRFKGEEVRLYDHIDLSVTVPKEGGAFNFAYLPFTEDYAAFDQGAAEAITQAQSHARHNPDDAPDDGVAFLSCLPWMDFTSVNNAMPKRDDCIPRVSWGKFVHHSDGKTDMAMSIEVHHALVDGEHIAAYFEAVQNSLNGFEE